MTVNVEYNQLDPLLRATSHPDGDANDDTGFSPFPGAWQMMPSWSAGLGHVPEIQSGEARAAVHPSGDEHLMPEHGLECSDVALAPSLHGLFYHRLLLTDPLQAFCRAQTAIAPQCQNSTDVLCPQA